MSFEQLIVVMVGLVIGTVWIGAQHLLENWRRSEEGRLCRAHHSPTRSGWDA
jgi:hypothetical protein